MIVDYEYYQTNYGGKLSPEEFTVYEARSEQFVDIKTAGRASIYLKDSKLTAKLKWCICELITAFRAYDSATESAGSGVVSSEKIGDMSVSYSSSSYKITAALRREPDEIIAYWLSDPNIIAEPVMGWV